MKYSYISKLSSKCFDCMCERLLREAWRAYTAEWSEEDFEEADNSQSNTSNISEFEHCEFEDSETMKDLLSPVRYKIWKFLRSR